MDKYLKWKPQEGTAEKFKTQFQTPVDVASFMANMVPSEYNHILEPTPGIGNIVNALTKKGFNVTAPNDFFLLEKQRFDCVVMNPPFSSKYAFLENAPDNVFQKSGMRLGYFMLLECLKMSDHVIALMPWFTLSDSDVRLRTLKKHGMKTIIALPRRTFEYARIQTVIIEMKAGYTGDTVFKVLDQINQENQLNIL